MPSVPEKQKRKGHPVPFLSFTIPILLQGSSQNIYIRSVKRERFGKKASGLCHQLDHPHPLAGVIEHLSIHTALQIFELYYTFERGHPASSVAATLFLAVIEHCSTVVGWHPLLLVANWRPLPLPLLLSDITLDSIPHHTVGRVGISIHLLCVHMDGGRTTGF